MIFSLRSILMIYAQLEKAALEREIANLKIDITEYSTARDRNIDLRLITMEQVRAILFERYYEY